MTTWSAGIDHANAAATMTTVGDARKAILAALRGVPGAETLLEAGAVLAGACLAPLHEALARAETSGGLSSLDAATRVDIGLDR
jgi:hypothetical protein